MKWSFRIGRWLGIDVYVHATFLLLLGFVGVTGAFGPGGPWGTVLALGFLLAVFGCVLLHEYGHALAARRFGIPTRDITLLPIGGVARLERIPDRPIQELWVALAGPAVNVGIVVVLAMIRPVVAAVGDGPGVLSALVLLERLLWVNAGLVAFNLLPAFPMDGGRVLRALLALRLRYDRATRWAATLGQGMALIFAFFGLLGVLGVGGNPFLLLIALFVWIGAGQEAEAASTRVSLAGARVRDAMLTDFRALLPRDPLSKAVDAVLSGSQNEFPVVDGARVVGILTRRHLLLGLSGQRRCTLVGEAMETEFEVADAGEVLEEAIRIRGAMDGRPVPVMEGGRLVGLLTWDNITDYMLIRAALRGV